jgi:hypothetical protein
MALQDFARLAVAMDGNVLTQISSIKATWNSGQNRVDLLNEGLSGFTPGSGDVSVDIGYLVPIGGMEEDYTGKLVTGTYVTMQLFIGPKDYVGRGKIMTCEVGQSTNATTEGTLNWTGELKPIE